MRIENITQNIGERRKQKGYSHENMAHELQLSQAAYTKIENNETKLTVERLFQISDILGTSVVDLLNLETTTIYNQHNYNESTGYLQHIKHLQQDSISLQHKLIEALEEEIRFLRTLLTSPEPDA